MEAHEGSVEKIMNGHPFMVAIMDYDIDNIFPEESKPKRVRLSPIIRGYRFILYGACKKYSLYDTSHVNMKNEDSKATSRRASFVDKPVYDGQPIHIEAELNNVFSHETIYEAITSCETWLRESLLGFLKIGAITLYVRKEARFLTSADIRQAAHYGTLIPLARMRAPQDFLWLHPSGCVVRIAESPGTCETSFGEVLPLPEAMVLAHIKRDLPLLGNWNRIAWDFNLILPDFQRVPHCEDQGQIRLF